MILFMHRLNNKISYHYCILWREHIKRGVKTYYPHECRNTNNTIPIPLIRNSVTCHIMQYHADEELDRATGVKRLRVDTNMRLEDATIADTETMQSRIVEATGINSCFISQHSMMKADLLFKKLLL